MVVRITANVFDRLSAPRSASQRNTMSVHEAFYAYPAPGPGRVAVYEYYVRQNGGGVRFFYSREPNVTSGCTRLGVAFYVPSSS